MVVIAVMMSCESRSKEMMSLFDPVCLCVLHILIIQD